MPQIFHQVATILGTFVSENSHIYNYNTGYLVNLKSTSKVLRLECGVYDYNV